MTTRLSPEHLDAILALQLSVAWAGEAAGDRLGWWKTDLVDAEGGGALFARLAPRTAPWASLVLVRAAAQRVDADARALHAGGDSLRTLFHFGFAIDEQLADRLAYHRAHEHVPRDVFGERFLVGSSWSRSTFEAWLTKLGAPKVSITPSGRAVDGSRANALESATLLAAALAPLAASYPLPYVEVES